MLAARDIFFLSSLNNFLKKLCNESTKVSKLRVKDCRISPLPFCDQFLCFQLLCSQCEFSQFIIKLSIYKFAYDLGTLIFKFDLS